MTDDPNDIDHSEPEPHEGEIELCPFPTRDECWDDQEARADINFTCPVHGQAHDTLDRLGVDVL